MAKQTTEFREVLFHTDYQGGKSFFATRGFAFEMPDWPEVHAVAHEDDGQWVATHWESGLRFHPVEVFWSKRNAVPAGLDAALKRIGRERVLAAIAPWL